MALPLRLAPEAARVIREEVARAGGREVSFLAEVTRDRVIAAPRAVARGNRAAVLAVARDAPEGGLMLHNHPSGLLEPSDADLTVAARLHDEGIGTAIVNNAVNRIYVVVEPPESRQIEALNADELSDLLGPAGPLSTLPGYEDRIGQRRMLRFVTGRFNEGGVGLVEAGTGTGKSLAYLVPAVRWAVRNGERVVVSTNTINLQEQLAGKDLGLTEKVLGERLKWALVKGRGNYVSIRRAQLAAESARDLFADDRSGELAAILDWLERTQDGSRSDLSFTPAGEVWDEVKSETDACLRTRCPLFQECHYQRSRRDAAGADLLVVNHALFFSDLAVRIATENFRDGAVLPPYRRVIFDEAHHLEDAATARLGTEITRAGLFRALSRLDRRGKGILSSLEATLKTTGGSLASPLLLKRIRDRTRRRVEKLRNDLRSFFDLIEPWTEAHAASGSVRLGGPPGGLEPTSVSGIRESLDRTLIALGDLGRELTSLYARINAQGESGVALEGRLLDLRASKTRLESGERALRLCLLPGKEDSERVRWLEVRRSGRPGFGNLVMATATVDLGPLLAESLFGNTKTVVLTSATLATKGDFSYLKGRLGLDGASPPAVDGDGGRGRPTPVSGTPEEVPGDLPNEPPDVAQVVVQSPFDFESRSRLVVPTDLPGPGGERKIMEAYHRATANVIYEVAAASGGGLFALFTSFAALRAAASALRARGAEGRWPLFVQGEGGRSRFLREFIASGAGVLLGTASFWEGVDVPGEPLRALVIQKLPFRVPTEPITEARVEAMERRGQNPFLEFMVPEAAIRLKQGIGRLIRSRTDRGVVVLLDDRILKKRYGRILRKALPPMPLIRGPWAEAKRHVTRFYEA